MDEWIVWPSQKSPVPSYLENLFLLQIVLLIQKNSTQMCSVKMLSQTPANVIAKPSWYVLGPQFGQHLYSKLS